jgi:hypothetical protein
MNKDKLQKIIDYLKNDYDNDRDSFKRNPSDTVWLLPKIFPEEVTRNINDCEDIVKYGECYCEKCMDHPLKYKDMSMQFRSIMANILEISYNQADIISTYQMRNNNIRGTIKSCTWRFNDESNEMLLDIPEAFRTYESSTVEDVVFFLEWYMNEGNEYWDKRNK